MSGLMKWWISSCFPLKGYISFHLCKVLLTKYLVQELGYNACAERWKNMVEEITNRMWGIFDETGVFEAFCHHGFALIITDMVWSGEQ